jgi:hypothetical protein
MSTTRDYAFASGGILWKVLDRPKFEAKSLREQIYVVAGLVLVCWLPLAVLSVFNLGLNQFYLLFIRDVSTHVRFLFVLPLFVVSRRYVNKAFDQAINFFYETGIVDSRNSSELEQLMRRLDRWKKSKIVDGVIIVLVYLPFFLQDQRPDGTTSAYAPWHFVDDRITPAGWWYLLLSLPVLHLLLYRWMYTIFLWMIFLRKIARLNLHLSALHPDGVGGLGFLHYTQISFAPVALAFSALSAGVTNNLIIFSKVSLADYKVAIGSVILFVFLLFILPLLQLMPVLAKTKRKFYMAYSLESWPIARKFEKQLADYYETGEEKPDTSWHVDLLGSFEKAKDMKVILVDRVLLLAFAASIILPFLPVVAQQVPIKQLLSNIMGKFLL